MNKYQKSLSSIERFSNYWNNTERVNNNLEPHFNILQELVDKQKPAKMLWNAHGFRKCGYCDNLLHLRNLSRYCDVCGQKIDWGEYDEK